MKTSFNHYNQTRPMVIAEYLQIQEKNLSRRNSGGRILKKTSGYIIFYQWLIENAAGANLLWFYEVVSG
jgi:hypothetical protein